MSHDYSQYNFSKDSQSTSVIDAVRPRPAPLAENGLTENSVKKVHDYYGLIGYSPQMRKIYSLIDRIANTRATVILRGESGTGKRMIAHAIHKIDTYRRDKPFIEVSCGALPREVIESELFGHTKGSFTGAIADRKGRFE